MLIDMSHHATHIADHLTSYGKCRSRPQHEMMDASLLKTWCMKWNVVWNIKQLGSDLFVFLEVLQSCDLLGLEIDGIFFIDKCAQVDNY